MASFANDRGLLQAASLLQQTFPDDAIDSDSRPPDIESGNSNTSKKTRHDVALFFHYLQTTKNENRPMLDIESDTLDSYIAEFLSTIRQKDSSQYEPGSLRSIFASLERYLKANNYSYSSLSEYRFEKAREALRSKQKELKQQGKGNRPNAARAITEEEQDLLYKKGILGMHNAEALLNTIWWNVTRFFGMRAGAEQHKLQWGDVTLRTAANGIEFCEFNERQMKIRSGADLRTIGSVTPKMWAVSNNGDNPRDPVAVYKRFSEIRPAAMKRPHSPFYLAINNSKGHDWFKCQPLGINTLKSLMKKMFTKAALPIKGVGKITNHSARKTMVESMIKDFPLESVSIPSDLVLQPGSQNESTERKTKSCLKRILLFFEEHGESRPPECLSPTELDQMIAFFFKETKRLDGEEFQPISLKSFQNSLDRYLRTKNYPYSVLNDSVFSLSRNVLWARKKELKECGKVSRPITIDTLTPAEEEQLWKKGYLGNVNDPSSLQRTVWFFNQKAMRFKGSGDAYQLTWGDVQLKPADQNSGEAEYLRIDKRVFKQRFSSTGLLQRPQSRILLNLDEPLRCPIRFFKAFAKKRPRDMLRSDSPFYLAVRTKRYDNPTFYKSSKLGIHALEKILKRPIDEIRYSGKFWRISLGW